MFDYLLQHWTVVTPSAVRAHAGDEKWHANAWDEELCVITVPVEHKAVLADDERDDDL